MSALAVLFTGRGRVKIISALVKTRTCHSCLSPSPLPLSAENLRFIVDGRKEIDLEKCYKKRNDSSCLQQVSPRARKLIYLHAQIYPRQGKINPSLSSSYIDREPAR